MAPSKKQAAASVSASNNRALSDTEAAMQARGLFGPTWSAAEKAKLAPHVVNLRAGRFVSSGDYETTPDDVRRIFDRHLPAELERAKAEGRKLRVLFWAHGGLVKEKASLQYALDHIDTWMSAGVYPIFFVWETGLKTALKDIIVGGQRSTGERGFVTDKLDKLLEKTLHKPVEAIWTQMKDYADAAAAPDGGARFTAEELASFARNAGSAAEYYACGHSAGSIFHAHFLPTVAAAGGPAIRDLFLLAPAITVDLFKKQLTGKIGEGKGIDRVTMFTMDRQTELDDNVIRIYSKSLLYFVKNACEPKVPTPILGLEESLKEDAAMSRLFGIGSPSANGEIIWSPGSRESSGISASSSTSHGGFDNDHDTLNSLARRITGNHSITPFVATRAFGAAPTGRRRAVCIGIDDYPTAPLSGCVNDATLWRDTLAGLGFDARLITNGEASRLGMLAALGELVGSSRPGDSLVFQYAGHGTQVDDVSGDETDDGLDEALVPFDYQDGQFLIDDDIGEVLDDLPDGVSLTCFMDCCNSGTNTRAFLGTRDNRPDAGERVRFLKVPQAIMRKHIANRKGAPAGSPQNPFEKKPEVLFAACRPDQTAKESGGHGYFTLAATGLLKNSAGKVTNREFHSVIGERFEDPPPYAQNPALDCDASLEDALLLFSPARQVATVTGPVAQSPDGGTTPAISIPVAGVPSDDARLIIETMHDYMQILKRLL